MRTERERLEAQFHDAMLAICHRAKAEAGYTPTRFLQLVQSKGGVAAAAQLLEDPEAFSGGFTRLALKGRLDLTVEALINREPWSSLFSESQRRIARRRLK